MAIPFCLPDQNNNNNASGSASASQNTSGASSAIQSPLLSPVTDAQFMQAFCEALYRCAQNGSLPDTPLMSPVMSPNPDSVCGHYAINPTNGNRFFFPQIPRAQMSPSTPVSRQQPQYSGRVTAQNYSHQQRMFVPRRVRLSSLNDDDVYEDVFRNCASVSDSESEEEVNNLDETVNRDDLMLHLRHMEAREQLQIFPGRVPPPKNVVRRKRELQSSNITNDVRNRNSSNISNNIRISMKDTKPEQKIKDSFKWPTVVTVVMIAVGCGILVSR